MPFGVPVPAAVSSPLQDSGAFCVALISVTAFELDEQGLHGCSQILGSASQVTRGVRVSASPLFVPEHSKLSGDGGSPRNRYFFAYWCADARLLWHAREIGCRFLSCMRTHE